MQLQQPVTEPLKSHIRFSEISHYVRPAALPVLLAVIPTLYHYSNNVEKLTPVSLYRMLIFNALLAVVIYLICLFFTKFQSIRAANAAFIFLIFFNIYGILYRYLLNLDVIRIKHYTLLPLTIMLAIYAIGLMSRLNNSVLVSLWKNLILVVGVLALFNLVNIVPAELKRWKSDTTAASIDAGNLVSTNKAAPDIYYILFDEFEGFQGMRDYWHYEGVDEFVRFLIDKGFFVAEASHGSSTDTLHEMATRFNYQEYPIGEKNLGTYFNDIADNQVMRYLKSRGYTTVVFDERKLGYPSSKTISADYSYEYGSSSIPQSKMGTYAFYFDEFGELVIDNTMLYAVSQKYKSSNPLISQHTNMISFTVDHIADKNVPSPKFTYVHLLLPHAPFMFDPNGNITDNSHFINWNYYIDNYQFSIKVAETIVDKILAQSDPKNPPVIVLQSDHGARNQQGHGENSVILQNYPEDLKTLIMFALYLPGYDYSVLPQDIKPINTFPIIFNYLFDEDIVLFN